MVILIWKLCGDDSEKTPSEKALKDTNKTEETIKKEESLKKEEIRPDSSSAIRPPQASSAKPKPSGGKVSRSAAVIDLLPSKSKKKETMKQSQAGL